MDKTYRKTDIFFLIPILGIMILFLIGTIVSPKSDISERENRSLASWPHLTQIAFKNQFGAIEEYLKDQLFLREKLLTKFMNYRLNFMGRSPATNVIIGNNGWLFEKSFYYNNGYLNNKLHTKEFLSKLVRNLDWLHHYLKRKGVDLFLIVSPESFYVYEENIPQSLKIRTPFLTREMFFKELSHYPYLKVIDPTPRFMEEKESHQEILLHYKWDPHWNDRGSFLGYLETIKVVNQKGDYAFSPPNNIKWVEGSGKLNSLMRFLGKPDQRERILRLDMPPAHFEPFPEKILTKFNLSHKTSYRQVMTLRNLNSESDFNLWIIGNSYHISPGLGFVDLLQQHFGKTTKLHIDKLSEMLVYLNSLGESEMPQILLLGTTTSHVGQLSDQVDRAIQTLEVTK